MILYIKYRLIVAFNTFIYALQHTPVIKWLVPKGIFGASKVKKSVIALTVVFRILKKILTTTIYFGVFYLLASLVFTKLNVKFSRDAFLYLYFCLNVVGVITTSVKNITFNVDKYHLVKTLQVPCRTVILADMVISCCLNTIGFLAVLSATAFYTHLTFLNIIGLIALNLVAKLCFEYLSSYLYLAHNVRLNDIKFFLPISILLLVLAYLPIYMKFDLSFFNSLLSPWTVGLTMILGVFATRALLIFNYRTLAKKALRYAPLMQIQALSEDATFLEAKMAIDNVGENVSQPLDQLKDYEYIHALFFERFHKTINQPVKRYVLFNSLIVLAFFVITYLKIWKISPEMTYVKFLSGFLLYTSFLNLGETYTKLLFYHMDKNFLPYPFYRKSEAVLKSLKIRFKKLFKVLLIPNMVIIMGACAYFVYYYPSISMAQLIFIPLWILLGSLFFGLNSLFIYYIFQPYRKDGIKLSTPAKINQLVISGLSLTIFNLRFNSILPFVVVLVLMVVYLLILIYFTSRLAAKNFRL